MRYTQTRVYIETVGSRVENFINMCTDSRFLTPHLADESGDEQKDQDAVMIAAVTQEGVRHEGGEERHLFV